MKFPRRNLFKLSAASLAYAGFMVGVVIVQGAEHTWNGSVDNNWATSANWSTNGVPYTDPAEINVRINVGASGTTTGNITWEKRLIYSSAQGTTQVGGASTAVRGLFIGNGTNSVGNMEITGGTLISSTMASDGMSNGAGSNSTLVIDGGTYRKTSDDNATGTFSLNYGVGTSLLHIKSGFFEVSRLNFLETTSTTAASVGTLQLDGGTLSVGTFLKSGTSVGGSHAFNLNGGILSSRIATTWGDLADVTWTLGSKSTFEINHNVTLAEPLGGTGGFEKTGTGNFTLTGTNNYTGVTTVSGTGALVVSNQTALGSSGAGNDTVVNSGARLVLANGITVTGETVTIAGGGGGSTGDLGALRAGSNASATWNGAVITSGSGARIGAQFGGHLTINGDINATAGNAIIRTEGGASTTGAQFDNTAVTLGGTYTGSQLIIFQGVLKLGASDRIQDTALVNMGTSASTDIRQRFDLNGFDETIAGLTVSGEAPSATHEVTNTAAAPSTLTLSSAANREFSGIVTGNLAITKEGSSILTFSGVNTYTGNTSVNNGTFSVSTAGALNGGGSTTIGSGATFSLLGTFLFDIGANGVNNSISGAGTANLTGTFHIDLTDATRVTGNSWQLVNTSGSTNWNGLQITSTSGAFTEVADVWTLDDGNGIWTFRESTGVLSFVIPEPGHTAMLLLALAGFSARRRRLS